MNLENIIKNIEKYKYVVFYYEQDRDFEKLLMHTEDDETTCIDLNTSEDLSSLLLAHYNIENLPALLYGNGVVYAQGNIQEQMDILDDKNIIEIKEFLNKFILKKGITLFIKGTIEKPYCKYTKELLKRLEPLNIKNIKDFDILTDKKLRRYMKYVNSWDTYPMIYVDNKFIGGLDAFINYIDNGGKF